MGIDEGKHRVVKMCSEANQSKGQLFRFLVFFSLLRCFVATEQKTQKRAARGHKTPKTRPRATTQATRTRTAPTRPQRHSHGYPLPLRAHAPRAALCADRGRPQHRR